MNQPLPDTLSKGQFAELINVSPGRISQYITEGKLTGDALDGQGRRAKIRVAPALDQLQKKLDIGQMMGNGLATRLQPSVTPSNGGTTSNSQATATVTPAAPTVEDRLKQEKLFQSRITSRKAAEDEERRKGRFTETAAVKTEMVRMSAKLMQTFEGALPDLANAVAARFEVPSRDVLHLLRQEFRVIRERAAKQAKENAEAEPKTVQAEIETASDS